jgi:hypothetical protein
MEKISTTAQWMKNHPEDTPCPRDPDSARAWRIKPLEPTPRERELARKYQEAMAEKRARGSG